MPRLLHRTIDYSYDALSRLLQADYNNGTVHTYGFDVAGNLTNINSANRIYNAANQMTHDGTNPLEYDDNGNLWKINGVQQYTWDRANRLLSHAGTSYVYDGNSNRISQTVSSVVTEYLVDTQPALSKVLRESDGTNTTHFVHAPRGIHAMEDNAGNWVYAAQDALGSVRAEVNSSGVIAASQNHELFGGVESSNGSFASSFGFTGEQTDGNGQIYLRARHYNPALGIFPSLDPFEGLYNRPMSLNGYSWVEGNPVMHVDPSGLCPSPIRSTQHERYDALVCHQMVESLRTKNIYVIWENSPTAILAAWNECVNDQNFTEFTANDEERGLRWATGEVRAIFNAFRIFERAYNNTGMGSRQYWPLSANNRVKYVKTSYKAALGKHQYNSRSVKLSASRWGEGGEIDGYNSNNVTNPDLYRSWLALHEFAHILIKDFADPSLVDTAADTLTGKMELEGFDFFSQIPTAYSTASDPELATEVVTGTLWNQGSNALFSEDGGGRTGTYEGTDTDWYNGRTWTVTNIQNISRNGETLEDWIINNFLRLQTNG